MRPRVAPPAPPAEPEATNVLDEMGAVLGIMADILFGGFRGFVGGGDIEIELDGDDDGE